MFFAFCNAMFIFSGYFFINIANIHKDKKKDFNIRRVNIIVNYRDLYMW